MKDGAHLLQLASDAAGLLFVGVGENGEVRTLNLEPVWIGIARKGRDREAGEDDGRDVLVHEALRVNYARQGGKRTLWE
jgi:hypothetical protein